jgi:methyl-accepting chemotaxis protein
VTQLSKTTQTNAAASEELAATAEEMNGQVEQLKKSVSFFKLESEVPVAANKPRSPVSSLAKAKVARAATRTAGNLALAGTGGADESHYSKF